MDNFDDKYAPLSADELSATLIDAPPAHDDGEIVAPVPPDAPPAPAVHSRFGNPAAVWKYLDAQGSLLFEVHRYDPPGKRKQFLPLSLWREPSGALRWKWKGYPAPRPLYNLDKLAAAASAPVVICEGEKSADAAATVFPKSVCVTSSGGSQAASKADWTPLAGRRVLIWPDADAPGEKYAREVATILHALDCDVSLVDSMALAGVASNGRKREPVQGWDCADAAAEWPHLVTEGQPLERLRKTAVAFSKPFAPGPSYISWGAFTMDADGLSIEMTRGKGDNAETVRECVSAPFEVLGATRDPHGRDWGKWLKWRDRDGREHLRHISEAALQGDPASLAASLAADGLPISRTQQRALASYLCGVETKGRVTLVPRTGWHTVGGRDVFVLPGETIGPHGSERVILDAAAHGPYEARGTLADWQGNVAALAGGHVLPVLAISAALAGPLLHLAGQEGGALHFFGPSSKGKTTLLQLAASVWGRGASPGFVRAWRATANGLEGAAASATDTALILDELGQVEAREASATFYSLANGTGKARAARDGSLREPKSWRVLSLSTGEIPTATKLAEDRGRKARGGQFVRFLDIPADRGLAFGAFDNAGPDGDAAALAKTFKQAAQSSYGTAGPEFVRRLIAENADGETVRAMVADFMASTVPRGSDGQIDRAAQRFGLIAAAGHLATVFGVTPWREDEAQAAAAWALEQWIAQRGGTEPAEVRQAIEQVRLAIQMHGESRFEPLDGDPEARPVNNRLGWRKGDGAEREWWIAPETWRAEICAGLDASFVAKVLAGQGLLRLPNGRGFQCKVNIGGDRRANAYVLTAGILDGGDDAA